jgi:hypothetical protein
MSSTPDCSYGFGEYGENYGSANIDGNYYVGACKQANDLSLTCTDANNDGLCDDPFLFVMTGVGAQNITDNTPRVFGFVELQEPIGLILHMNFDMTRVNSISNFDFSI